MVSFGKKTTKMKVVGQERRSKLTKTSGIGALVEFPGFSGIMGGQNLWPSYIPESMIIHEKSLEDYMGYEFFVQPTSDSKDSHNQNSFSVPVVRFPDYHFCPNCHELDYARRIAKNIKSDKNHTEALLCSNCGKELLPSRFITACESGHVDEFPYNWWVHKGKECANPKLKIDFSSTSSGLGSIHVSCTVCGAHATMEDCLNKEAFADVACHGRSPWLGAGKTCACGKPLRVLMRGASNVYFPQTISTLTIPPWSTSIQRIIEQHHAELKTYFQQGMPPEFADMGIGLVYQNQQIGKLANCSQEEFLEQVKLRFKPVDRSAQSPQSLLYDEYKAFIGPDQDDIYLKTQSAAIAPTLSLLFDKVTLVKRLREVEVLYGFRRINAFSEDISHGGAISTHREKWLPAVEMLGEGIFIQFSREQLDRWQTKRVSRYTKMELRYNTHNMAQRHGSFSPIYVCLHTFSHLLMKELAFQCGYEASSIKERLYISDDSDKWMAGVLIYTATSCSDGSLGGLVRLGQQDRLAAVIASMLERASWCSNDPICIESTEQGMLSLNYAACHACTLAPEISCSCSNLLLDRAAVVGANGLFSM